MCRSHADGGRRCPSSYGSRQRGYRQSKFFGGGGGSPSSGGPSPKDKFDALPESFKSGDMADRIAEIKSTDPLPPEMVEAALRDNLSVKVALAEHASLSQAGRGELEATGHPKILKALEKSSNLSSEPAQDLPPSVRERALRHENAHPDVLAAAAYSDDLIAATIAAEHTSTPREALEHIRDTHTNRATANAARETLELMSEASTSGGTARSPKKQGAGDKAKSSTATRLEEAQREHDAAMDQAAPARRRGETAQDFHQRTAHLGSRTGRAQADARLEASKTELRKAKRAHAQATRKPADISSLKPGDRIKTDIGWSTVRRVSAKSITVEPPFPGADATRFAHGQVLETRAAG